MGARMAAMVVTAIILPIGEIERVDAILICRGGVI